MWLMVVLYQYLRGLSLLDRWHEGVSRIRLVGIAKNNECSCLICADMATEIKQPRFAGSRPLSTKLLNAICIANYIGALEIKSRCHWASFCLVAVYVDAAEHPSLRGDSS